MALGNKYTPGWKQFISKYGFLIVSAIIFANVGLVYAVRIRGFAVSPCDTTFMTPAQVSADARCLYIYSSKVYLPPGASKTSPHHGHTCGADITSIIPNSHKSALSAYLSPYCVATIGTSVPTATPTLTPTKIPTLTPTRTPTPTPTKIPPTNTPVPTFIPTATPWQFPTATSTPQPAACISGDLGNLNCDSLGLINEMDLSILLSNWAPLGSVPTPGVNRRSADITGDGKVDETDMAKLLNNWKTQ